MCLCYGADTRLLHAGFCLDDPWELRGAALLVTCDVGIGANRICNHNYVG